MERTDLAAGRRPFHICPDCNAYNARFLERCWRCERDMTQGGAEPAGVLGYRLEEMANASNASSEPR
jgi:hypothetical protein